MLNTDRKAAIYKLLKNGIEQGDESALQVISEERYIQHNPQTLVQRKGLAALFKQLASTHPHVNIARIFEDGDYVFAHTEYDFSRRNIGFEVFRFEGEVTVEHWDNIQPRQPANLSGHSMVDGATTISDHEFTEENRMQITRLIESVFIQGNHAQLADFVSNKRYTEHNAQREDGIDALRTALQTHTNGVRLLQYQKLHRVLAEGNFVLAVCEGLQLGKHSAFYDLFRLEQGRVVEHWDTTETVPDKTTWKNQNGKF